MLAGSFPKPRIKNRVDQNSSCVDRRLLEVPELLWRVGFAHGRTYPRLLPRVCDLAVGIGVWCVLRGKKGEGVCVRISGLARISTLSTVTLAASTKTLFMAARIPVSISGAAHFDMSYAGPRPRQDISKLVPSCVFRLFVRGL